MELEWNKIDLEDRETLPNDFEPVLCWTTDNTFQILMMLRYGDDIESWEWETQGLKRDNAFPIEYVVKWVFIKDPDLAITP